MDLDLPLIGVSVAGIGGLLPQKLIFEVEQLDVVVLMEHVMDRGQPKILVRPAVAGDVVIADQFQQEFVGHRPVGRAGNGRIIELSEKSTSWKSDLVGAVIVMDHESVRINGQCQDRRS